MFRHTAPLAVAAALAALLSSSAPAQQPHGDGHDHEHAPPQQVGRAHLTIACSPEAQRRFDRALALLHSFWYEEAEKAFGEVAAADSGCAMAHWGVAMSLLHPLWAPPTPAEMAKGLAAAERGLALGSRSARDRGYVEAIATYYRNHERLAHAERMLAYEGAMERLVRRHGRDREASIFYALALIANASPTDTTYARQKRAARILLPLFEADPDHPGLAHYVIHTYDSPPLARLALDAARRYARIAPSVPHALHMPSHIFTRLGLWQESIESNRASAEAARRYEIESSMDGVWSQRMHAWDYLAYAALQLGRDAEAAGIVEEASRVTKRFPPAPLGTEYALAAIPARYALERGRWAEAARLVPLAKPDEAPNEAAALTRFARAIGAARAGDTALAAAEVAALADFRGRLAASGPGAAYAARQMEVQHLAASAWLTYARGDTAEALRLARAAADLEDATEKRPVTPGPLLPARELEGDLLLESGRHADALRAYTLALGHSPRRTRSVYGAARAAELAGDRAAARRHYRELLTLLEHAEGERPELEAARRALASR